VAFADKTKDDKGFVEHLWARRKVGYLLDQIRANGEKKELVDETVALAKKYGIATPYTSYLIVPDSPVPVANARFGTGLGGFGGGGLGGGLAGQASPMLGGSFAGRRGAGPPSNQAKSSLPPDEAKVLDVARSAQNKPGDLAENRGKMGDRILGFNVPQAGEAVTYSAALREAGEKKQAFDQARQFLARRQQEQVQ